MIDVSIIICTYNRCEHLSQLLKSVTGLALPADLSWEVVVVDNNSTDATASVAGNFCASDEQHFRYAFEGRQGKSFALNTAIKLARGRILAFTDDDALLPADWIARIADEFRSDPRLAGLGGRVELYRSDDAAVGTRRGTTRFTLDPNHFSADNIPIIGCNMAMKREVIDALGGFETGLGPGAKAGVGEDLDFLYRALRSGYKIVYTPDVHVFHDHGRQTKTAIDRVKRNYIAGRGGFYWKHIRSGDRYVAKLAFWRFTARCDARGARELMVGASARSYRSSEACCGGPSPSRGSGAVMIPQ
jgi:GT2 family glycosyltransferase